MMEIKTGVDIVKIDRIEDLFQTYKERFLNRFFSEKEIAYISDKNFDAKTMAAIFAAKEAFFKMLGTGFSFGFKNIVVLHDASGRPKLEVVNSKELYDFKIANLDLSLSHDGDYAIATVIASLIKTNTDISYRLKPRKRESNKGTYGKIGIIAGSIGMTGAPYLVAIAALRSGAGLVYSFVPDRISDIMSIKSIENIIVPLNDGGSGVLQSSWSELEAKVSEMDLLAIGPGLGRDERTKVSLREILKNWKGKLVLDADGINCVSAEDIKNAAGELILTPHPGEFSRLTGLSIAQIQMDREGLASEYAKKLNAVILLKGNNTVIASPDGECVINRTGNPGMATAGSGDVLTGIIAALIGQGLDRFKAAKIGAYVHGLAGDFAAKKIGEYGMIARDIVDNIPIAISSIEE